MKEGGFRDPALLSDGMGFMTEGDAADYLGVRCTVRSYYCFLCMMRSDDMKYVRIGNKNDHFQLRRGRMSGSVKRWREPHKHAVEPSEHDQSSHPSSSFPPGCMTMVRMIVRLSTGCLKMC